MFDEIEAESFVNQMPLTSLSSFISKLHPKSHILDMGCGNGLPVSKLLSDHSFQVLGIDISESFLQAARNNVPNASFLHLDFTIEHNLLLLSGKGFSGIVCSYSLMQMNQTCFVSTLKCIHSMLSIGGYFLYISTYSPKTTDFKKVVFYGVEGYATFYSFKDSLAFLQMAGFEIVETSVDGAHAFSSVICRKRAKGELMSTDPCSYRSLLLCFVTSSSALVLGSQVCWGEGGAWLLGSCGKERS
uniref:Methyltransferase domain-containing protein n=1 Tax=Arcella intermedia TaxID=1963864 RepID=A0A6B2LFM5_9EUKA